MERSKKPSAIPVSPVLPTPQVSISDNNDRVSASLPTGERVEVLLHGATVISWTSANGKENLFLSSKAHLDGSKPVRGGIPLVFPVFGPPPSKDHATGNLPQHGFARTSRWEYLGKTSSESSTLPNSSGDSSVKLDFGLSDTMIGDSKWPYQFALTYSVTLSPKDLETSLVVRNTGTSNYDFQVLFHTYLKVDDISEVSVSGLENASFKDKVKGDEVAAANEPVTISSEVDRVYNAPPDQPITVSENGSGRFEVTRDMLSDVVVWNPWIEKSKGMSDFGPEDGYKNIICVEAGSVSAWNSLEAGDAWEGGQRIKTLS